MITMTGTVRLLVCTSLHDGSLKAILMEKQQYHMFKKYSWDLKFVFVMTYQPGYAKKSGHKDIIRLEKRRIHTGSCTGIV